MLTDLTTALARLAPEQANWTHNAEGPDDMPAHVKTMLTATSLHIPVLGGELMLAKSGNFVGISNKTATSGGVVFSWSPKPWLTSADTATFTSGQAGSFTVSTAAQPTAPAVNQSVGGVVV